MSEDWGDGWGGDDELDDLIGDDEGQPTTGGSSGVEGDIDAPAQDGWGDDDDLGDLSGEDEVANYDHVNQQDSNNRNQEQTKEEVEEEGWGEDDDVLDHLSGSDNDNFQEASEYEDEIQTDFVNNDNSLMTPPPQRRSSNRGRVDQIHQELIAYVEALMFMLPSVNAVLEAEYNQHPQKARDLVHYYHERPQLCQYTIDKELNRMDYGVILDDAIIDNKPEIAQLLQLQPELHMLARCANQSLLADLLQVMTGPDRMVRPQYMATCLAESCRFTIRSPSAGGTVECHCQMVLSLPEPSGTRYPVARLRVHIVFAPMVPTIRYHLESMDIVLRSMDLLRPTAEFLVESGLLDHPDMLMSPDIVASPNTAEGADDFRDIFLQQSQTLFQNSSVGLKSAWQQIDSVAGFQNKFNLVKKILPTSGGSGLLQAALDEQDEWHQELARERQVQQRLQLQEQRPPPPVASNTVPVAYPQQAPPPQQAPVRPQSILGSFMGRLAQTVALPDDDPSIYESYTKAQTHQTQQHHSSASSDGPPYHPPPVHFPRPQEVQDTHSAPPPVHFPRPQEVHATPGPAPVHFPRPEVVQATKEPTRMGGSPWANLTQQSSPPVDATLAQEDHGDGWGDDDDIDLDLDDNDIVGADYEQSKAAGVSWEGSSPKAMVPPTAPVCMPADTPTKLGNITEAPQATTKQIAEWQRSAEGYNSEDDIIETRKRWVNPRPGSRRLSSMLS